MAKESIIVGGDYLAIKEGSVLGASLNDGIFSPVEMDYERVGAQTYYDKFNQWKSAKDNTPVVEYDENGEKYLSFHRQGSNRINWSNDITQSDWAKTRGSASLVNGVSKFTEDTSNSTHYFEQSFLDIDGVFVIQAKLEPSEITNIRLAGISIGDSQGVERTADFDLVNLTSSNPNAISSHGIQRTPDGMVNCWIKYTVDSNVTSHRVRVNSLKGGAHSYLGDGTSGFFVHNIDARESSSISAHILTDSSIATRYGAMMTLENIISRGLNTNDNFAVILDLEIDSNQTTDGSGGFVLFRNSEHTLLFRLYLNLNTSNLLYLRNEDGIQVFQKSMGSELRRKIGFVVRNGFLEFFINGEKVIHTITNSIPGVDKIIFSSIALNAGSNVNVYPFYFLNRMPTDEEMIIETTI